MIKQKCSTNEVQNKILDPDNSNEFLDIIEKKGIRILQLNNVRKWCREHHGQLLETFEGDEESDKEVETTHMNKNVKKLTEPALKILDTTSQTRPSFHQKCIFNKDLFEETYSLPVECSPELTNESTQSKHGDSTKMVSKKSPKLQKTSTKPDGGYCECCSVNYTNLLNHLASPDHLSYATNDQNYQGIDQVISNVSSLSSFLTIRMRKQTILDRRIKNRKLIKSLSANDFKNENENVTPALQVVEVPPIVLHGNILDINDVIEQCEQINEIMENCITFKEYFPERLLTDIEVHCQIFYTELQYVADIEERLKTMVDMIEYSEATESLQEDPMNEITVCRALFQCGVELLHTELVDMSINEDSLPVTKGGDVLKVIETLEVHAYATLYVQDKVLNIVEIKRGVYQCRAQELDIVLTNELFTADCNLVSAMPLESERVLWPIEGIKDYESVKISIEEDYPMEKAQFTVNQSHCGSQILEEESVCDEFSVECETIKEVYESIDDLVLPRDVVVFVVESKLMSDSDDSDDDSDSSSSDDLPPSLANYKDNDSVYSFNGVDSMPNSPLSSNSKHALNAFSPFFLDKNNGLPTYSLLSPNFDYKPFGDSPQNSPVTIFSTPPPLTQDVIVDLRKCARNENPCAYFDTLIEDSLFRQTHKVNIDSRVESYFKSKFNVDLSSKPILYEITNINHEKNKGPDYLAGKGEVSAKMKEEKNTSKKELRENINIVDTSSFSSVRKEFDYIRKKIGKDLERKESEKNRDTFDSLSASKKEKINTSSNSSVYIERSPIRKRKHYNRDTFRSPSISSISKERSPFQEEPRRVENTFYSPHTSSVNKESSYNRKETHRRPFYSSSGNKERSPYKEDFGNRNTFYSPDNSVYRERSSYRKEHHGNRNNCYSQSSDSKSKERSTPRKESNRSRNSFYSPANSVNTDGDCHRKESYGNKRTFRSPSINKERSPSRKKPYGNRDAFYSPYNSVNRERGSQRKEPNGSRNKYYSPSTNSANRERSPFRRERNGDRNSYYSPTYSVNSETSFSRKRAGGNHMTYNSPLPSSTNKEMRESWKTPHYSGSFVGPPSKKAKISTEDPRAYRDFLNHQTEKRSNECFRLNRSEMEVSANNLRIP